MDSGELLLLEFFYYKKTEKRNSSHVDERGLFNLERDGSVVGGVRGDNAGGFSHLVAGVVHLAHLSQAGWRRQEKRRLKTQR